MSSNRTPSPITRRPRSPVRVAAATACAVTLAACGSSGTSLTTGTQSGSSAAPATPPPPTATFTPPTTLPAPNPPSAYDPVIDPATFTDRIDNRFLPLVPGSTHTYDGLKDGAPTLHQVTVTNDRRVVMGVNCVVVQDVVTQAGSLIEKTTDWYAQDASGNVWYFGEDTAEYQNGVVTSTAGTWEAGVDGAKPGIVMKAAPVVGDYFRQEYRPGSALDIAQILSIDTTTKVPAGTYRGVVVTLDKNPLDPSKIEHKFFASGVGFIRAELAGGGHLEITRLVR